jgi:hypothetical protein
MFPVTNTFVSRDNNINGKSIIVRKLLAYNAKKRDLSLKNETVFCRKNIIVPLL